MIEKSRVKLTSQQGGTGVSDGLAAAVTEGLILEGDTVYETRTFTRRECLLVEIERTLVDSPVHLELPVGLTSHVQVGEVANVVAWVGASQKELTTLRVGWISLNDTRNLTHVGGS